MIPPVERGSHNYTTHGSGEKTQNGDGTTGENYDDSITKLTDDLSFMKNDFHNAINETSASREVASNVMMNMLSTIQTKFEFNLAKLATFMKSTFKVQDKVIISLKEG